MKIVHISSYDIAGGAARSAYRLHQGLLSIDRDSYIVTRFKISDDERAIDVRDISLENNRDWQYANYIQRHYLNSNRTSITNTLFSLAYFGLDVTELSVVKNADVINLHWIANFFQSPFTIKKLLDLNKPVVWTLHDMNPFTGGCHYSNGCDRYQEECLSCPQLSDDIYNLTRSILKDKLELINSPNLTIVTPSKWLAECAKKSTVFSRFPVRVIPYSLDTNIFSPLSKSVAKNFFNIIEDTLVLLIGAVSGKEERKGFAELIKVLNYCLQDSWFANLVNLDKLQLFCFGEPHPNLNLLNLKIHSFGNVNSDIELAKIYSAADIFILPSLEDNLPNTMLESMACGTPVIGFNIGGIPDLVNEGITGFLSPKNDLLGMSGKIVKLLKDESLRIKISHNCRQVMAEKYSLPIQAHNYIELYQQSIDKNKSSILNPQIKNNLSSKDNVFFSPQRGSAFNKIYKDLVLYSVAEELKIFSDRLTYKNNDITELNKIIANKDIHIKSIHDLLQEKDISLAQLNKQLQESLQISGNLEHQFNQSLQKIKQLEDKLNQSDRKSSELQNQLNQSNQTSEQLKNQIKEMEKSKFWKIRNKWFQLKQRFKLIDN